MRKLASSTINSIDILQYSEEGQISDPSFASDTGPPVHHYKECQSRISSGNKEMYQTMIQ